MSVSSSDCNRKKGLGTGCRGEGLKITCSQQRLLVPPPPQGEQSRRSQTIYFVHMCKVYCRRETSTEPTGTEVHLNAFFFIEFPIAIVNQLKLRKMYFAPFDLCTYIFVCSSEHVRVGESMCVQCTWGTPDCSSKRHATNNTTQHRDAQLWQYSIVK